MITIINHDPIPDPDIYDPQGNHASRKLLQENPQISIVFNCNDFLSDVSLFVTYESNYWNFTN